MREPEDFRDFVLSRRGRLLKTGWLLTGDWHAAEDLVQTALLKTYPHWQRVAADNPDAYVRRVLYTVYASWWRRRWRGEVSTAELPDRPFPGDAFASADDRRLVLDALRELPPRQRATIVLRYFDDLSERDTAAVLGCSVGTVKSQTAKALAQLRRHGVALQATTNDEVNHE